MKSIHKVFGLLLLCAALWPQQARAQRWNIWKGGQIGRATDWNCANNWSLGKVPDEACVAVIGPDYRNVPVYPVIAAAVEPVHYLLVLTGAKLEIKPNGHLEMNFPEACLFDGEIRNNGLLVRRSEAVAVLCKNTCQ